MENLEETWENVKKIGSLNLIMDIKSFISRKRDGFPTLGEQKTEYDFCFYNGQKELLIELEQFLNKSIENLKNVSENKEINKES